MCGLQNKGLIPCLHQEPYANMAVFSDMFNRVAKIIFHTQPEQELAATLYGISSEKGFLLGEGIDVSFEANPDRFREKFHLDDPFILYVGRKRCSLKN